MQPTEVEGLFPELIPASWLGQSEHLQCGGCNFHGEVKFYVFTDAPWCFDAVCDCPLPATLYA